MPGAPSPILIAGPTASGKSALALRLAEQHGGVVINADSMQVYRELRVLTARPEPEETSRAPHRLYGHVPAAEPYSVARWLEHVAEALAEAAEKGSRPIIVGGTGLYFKALTEGLSPVPPVSPEVRQRWRALAAAMPAGELHAKLAQRDSVMAERLAPADRQRIVRALEVFDETGRSLAEWHELPGRPLIDRAAATRFLVDVPRETLHRRCDARFDHMMARGALGEVRGLLALGLRPEMPAMRAIGVRPLAAHLEGGLALDEAIARAKAETRQYVKRQVTWARQHMADWQAATD